MVKMATYYYISKSGTSGAATHKPPDKFDTYIKNGRRISRNRYVNVSKEEYERYWEARQREAEREERKRHADRDKRAEARRVAAAAERAKKFRTRIVNVKALSPLAKKKVDALYQKKVARAKAQLKAKQKAKRQTIIRKKQERVKLMAPAQTFKERAEAERAYQVQRTKAIKQMQDDTRKAFEQHFAAARAPAGVPTTNKPFQREVPAVEKRILKLDKWQRNAAKRYEQAEEIFKTIPGLRGKRWIQRFGRDLLAAPGRLIAGGAEAVALGGAKIAAAAESVAKGRGKEVAREATAAAKKTPGAVVKSFDPRDPQGAANLVMLAALTAASGASAVKAKTVTPKSVKSVKATKTGPIKKAGGKVKGTQSGSFINKFGKKVKFSRKVDLSAATGKGKSTTTYTVGGKKLATVKQIVKPTSKTAVKAFKNIVKKATAKKVKVTKALKKARDTIAIKRAEMIARKLARGRKTLTPKQKAKLKQDIRKLLIKKKTITDKTKLSKAEYSKMVKRYYTPKKILKRTVKKMKRQIDKIVTKRTNALARKLRKKAGKPLSKRELAKLKKEVKKIVIKKKVKDRTKPLTRAELRALSRKYVLGKKTTGMGKKGQARLSPRLPKLRIKPKVRVAGRLQTVPTSMPFIKLPIPKVFYFPAALNINYITDALATDIIQAQDPQQKQAPKQLPDKIVIRINTPAQEQEPITITGQGSGQRSRRITGPFPITGQTPVQDVMNLTQPQTLVTQLTLPMVSSQQQKKKKKGRLPDIYYFNDRIISWIYKKNRFVYLPDLYALITGRRATKSQRVKLLNPKKIFTGLEARPIA